MARKETVTRVIDGDSFLTGSRRYPVRLANVYAPEKWQPGGEKAATLLKSLIQGKEVFVDTVARDSYGRTIANVSVGPISVNERMLEKTKK